MKAVKRGRPKLSKPKIDYGTYETQQKFKMCLTKPPLDVMYEKQILNDDQYKAGLYFKYLHYLIFGNLKIKAYDTTNLGGKSCNKNEDFILKKQYEYFQAIEIIREYELINLVQDIIIYEKPQIFLYIDFKSISYKNVKNYMLIQSLNNSKLLQALLTKLAQHFYHTSSKKSNVTLVKGNI
jgi:hypothetical protein